MRCDDWRQFDDTEIAPLIAAEADVYRRRYDWDVTEAWRAIEPARASGRLPGLIATDARGRRAGWACYLKHRDTLQIAALASSGPAVTRLLVAAIDGSAEARTTSAAALCLPDTAPGLADALVDAGFAVSPYQYLEAPVGPVPGDPDLRTWRVDDYLDASGLAERAYAGNADLRPFALGGTADEWREYVATLVAGTGCGRLRVDGSFVRTEGGALRAAVLATDLGPGTAHIAQLMVDPKVQGQGWGRRLVRAAIGSAHQSGARAITLLVAASNTRATGLYAALGFAERGRFLAAVRRQPRRSTSVAFATGGVSTRR